MIINYPIYKKSTVREYLESFYLSKSKIYTLFLDGNIYLNNHKVKENDIINKGDILQIDHIEEIDYKINTDIKLDIIYEDDYLLIINKPKNILIHNGKDNNDSLSNLVSGYYYLNGISLNVRFCHRLDYETSGLIIYAKDILTHSYMNHFIECHVIKRCYLAFCYNKFKNKIGKIDLPIGRDRHENKMRVSKTGKEAITHFEVIKNYKNYTLVKLQLETGRTHQIRCHLSYLNHPILGDTLYGASNEYIDRVALHSYSLDFIHPIYNEKMHLEAELPKDMKYLYEKKD